MENSVLCTAQCPDGHINLGSLGGTWIGWLFTAAVWGGQAMLFIGYALFTLFACAGVLIGVCKALQTFGAGVRKGMAR
jgi:hypothetical protein